jgi:hypothetical protein
MVSKLVDVIVIEVTVGNVPGDYPPWREVDARLAELGFGVRDVAGAWRDAASGALLQLDMIYSKRKS